MKKPSHEDQIDVYRTMLLIETGNLDEECRLHAYNHCDIAGEAARAASRAAGLKLDLEEDQGDWQTEIRDRLNAEGRGDGPKGRVTDKQVEAELASHPKLKARNRAIATAKAEARDWEALRESSKERGFQLRNLVDLVIAEVISPRSAKPLSRTKKVLEDSGSKTGNRARF